MAHCDRVRFLCESVPTILFTPKCIIQNGHLLVWCVIYGMIVMSHQKDTAPKEAPL